MKKYPLINSESEDDSLSNCPDLIYQTHPNPYAFYGHYLTYFDLHSAMLGDFCIIASIEKKSSQGNRWKISNIELKNCVHNFPR